jgi:hypothetical protein
MRVLLYFMLGAIYASLATPSFSKDTDKYPVALKGVVKSVQIAHHDASFVQLDIKLKFELINVGAKPVILLRAKGPNFVGIGMAQSEAALVAGNLLAKDYYGPSAVSTIEWDQLRTSLNKSSPPENLVHILMPNGSFTLEGSVTIGLPMESGKKSWTPKQESWETIRALSAVWIDIVCEVWPLSLEPAGARYDLVFGKFLQNKWIDSGLLLLDHITSEPIKLDLSSFANKPR